MKVTPELEWQLAKMNDSVAVGPLPVEEEGMVSKDEQHTAQIGLVNERLAGLEGHLFGRDGTNGAFGELRSDIKVLSNSISQMHADIHVLSEKHVTDCSMLQQAQVLLKKDIDAVGEIARTNRDRDRDTSKRFRAALIGLGVTAAGAAIWAGVQALI